MAPSERLRSSLRLSIIVSIGSPTVEASDVNELVALQCAGACVVHTFIGSIVSRVIAGSDRVEDSPLLLLSPLLGIVLQLCHHLSPNLWILLSDIGRLGGVFVEVEEAAFCAIEAVAAIDGTVEVFRDEFVFELKASSVPTADHPTRRGTGHIGVPSVVPDGICIKGHKSWHGVSIDGAWVRTGEELPLSRPVDQSHGRDLQVGALRSGGLATEDWPLVDGVGVRQAVVDGHLVSLVAARQVAEGAVPVGKVHQVMRLCAAHLFRDDAARHKRVYADATLELARLASTERLVVAGAPQLIADRRHVLGATVIRRHDYDRVVPHALSLERIDHLADTSVRECDHSSVRSAVIMLE
mmetsp:Transcript_92650/g.207103  ORF Transcript_92650/g.207103 Transcript_92650/m.207103 type:complete len:354 (-) Transcript_92650:215-1276(-)